MKYKYLTDSLKQIDFFENIVLFEEEGIKNKDYEKVKKIITQLEENYKKYPGFACLITDDLLNENFEKLIKLILYKGLEHGFIYLQDEDYFEKINSNEDYKKLEFEDRIYIKKQLIVHLIFNRKLHFEINIRNKERKDELLKGLKKKNSTNKNEYERGKYCYKRDNEYSVLKEIINIFIENSNYIKSTEFNKLNDYKKYEILKKIFSLYSEISNYQRYKVLFKV